MTHDDEDRVPGLERLATRRMPEADLWPGIASRLRPRRRPWIQMALAASVVTALAALLWSQLGGPPPSLPAAETAQAALPAPMLTADARAIVKANLSMTRQAEAQLRQALRQDPDSTALRGLLADVQRRDRELHALL